MNIHNTSVTMHSVTDKQVPPVPNQPETLRFPQRSFDFKKPEQRRQCLAVVVRQYVGPGFITMKPKISRYAYQQGNSSRKGAQPKSS